MLLIAFAVFASDTAFFLNPEQSVGLTN